VRKVVVKVIVLVDEEELSVDVGFLGKDFFVIVVVVVVSGLGSVFGLGLWSGFGSLLGLARLLVGLGGKRLGGKRSDGKRLSGSLHRKSGVLLGLARLLVLGLSCRKRLDLNRSLHRNGGVLLGLARLLVLGLSRRKSLDLGRNGLLGVLLGVLPRLLLLDSGSVRSVASGIHEILNDIIGSVTLNSDRLLGPRLAHLGLLDGLVLGGDELLHDLGVGGHLGKNILVVGDLVIEGRHETNLGEDLLDGIVGNDALGTETLGESVAKDEQTVELGSKRGLAGSLDLGLGRHNNGISGGHFQ
jgi:hypothetical protein